MKALKTKPNRGARLNKVASTQNVVGRDAQFKGIRKEWRPYYKALLQVRARLTEDQQQRVGEIVERLEPHSMSEADSATDEFDHGLAISEISLGQNVLFEIDEALKRILNGTYGVCEQTGATIPAKRLRAIPWTRFSKEVERRLEKKGTIPTPRLGVLHSVREA